ncbi:hypothetical protein [Mycolicibacterium sp. XJ775]
MHIDRHQARYGNSVTSRKRLLAARTATAACLGLPAPEAGAQPPGFPDLRKFKAVDAAQFGRPFSYPERWANVYLFFRTPDGLNCAIGPASWCTGNMPGLPADLNGACSSVHGERTGDPMFAFSAADGACEPTRDKTLNPGEKLIDSLTGTTCVVDKGNLTACIIPNTNHGFVLQTSGSWTF